MKNKLLAPLVALLALVVTLSSCYVETRPMYGGYGGYGRPHYGQRYGGGGYGHGHYHHGGGQRGGYYRGR